jgi:hypothetical protein
VTYCRYGTDYQKPTWLWGEHAPGVAYRLCPRANCHDANTETDSTSAVASMPNDPAERAKVFYELSESIREAKEVAYANPPRAGGTTGG